MNAQTAPKALLTRADTAETTADPSSVMTLLADYGTGGSDLTSYRSTFAKGAVGALRALHTKASELFFAHRRSPAGPHRRRGEGAGEGRLPAGPAAHRARLRRGPGPCGGRALFGSARACRASTTCACWAA
ncbi:hypothetical protein [Streptomyces sp. KL116D]|uniref:hypothetical protein n=1 Tax=Streptomyces sp. KL116D TaxID=3045152 RepID=UPI003558CB13